jgi:hypothetical protein
MKIIFFYKNKQFSSNNADVVKLFACNVGLISTKISIDDTFSRCVMSKKSFSTLKLQRFRFYDQNFTTVVRNNGMEFSGRFKSKVEVEMENKKTVEVEFFLSSENIERISITTEIAKRLEIIRQR